VATVDARLAGMQHAGIQDSRLFIDAQIAGGLDSALVDIIV
jgi:hypothetical protein